MITATNLTEEHCIDCTMRFGKPTLKKGCIHSHVEKLTQTKTDSSKYTGYLINLNNISKIQIGKYLIVELGGHSASGKTQIWFVRSTDGTELGNISWNSGWRKYWFNPFENTGYEEICLRNIADFCEKLSKLHKEKLKRDKDIICSTKGEEGRGMSANSIKSKGGKL
jgi:hypothetical protein